MSRIKARYVAHLTIDVDMDIDEQQDVSYEEFRDFLMNGLSGELHDNLAIALQPATVTIEQQYADVWRVDNA